MTNLTTSKTGFQFPSTKLFFYLPFPRSHQHHLVHLSFSGYFSPSCCSATFSAEALSNFPTSICEHLFTSLPEIHFWLPLSLSLSLSLSIDAAASTLPPSLPSFPLTLSWSLQSFCLTFRSHPKVTAPTAAAAAIAATGKPFPTLTSTSTSSCEQISRSNAF